MTGIIKKVVPGRQFGFITCNGMEYFFHRDDFYGHWTDLEIDLDKNLRIEVEFEIGDDKGRGPRAANVRRLDFPNEGPSIL